MALSATTIWDIRNGGSDTANGGAFDPGQTAGMFTDGAATVATGTSPVFTSASYNFVAGDVGAWIYIAAGTNWLFGWYQIASVAANAATLSAAIGAAILATDLSSTTNTKTPNRVSTAAGCATTASPTGATWSIDYSQQNAAQFTYTDLVSAGTGLTVSSVAFPFAKQQVGNSIVITGGTNFNTGRYVIASVAAGVATVVGPTNITTGAGATGTGGQGGAVATPGLVGGKMVAENTVLLKYNASAYVLSTGSSNVSGGAFVPATGDYSQWTNFIGWDTTRTVANNDANKPTIQVPSSSVTSITVVNVASGGFSAFMVRNIIVDGQSKSGIQGFSGSGANSGQFVNCKAINCTNSGFNAGSLSFCEASGCSTVAAIVTAGACFGCISHDNTITGFSIGGSASIAFCIAYNNTGSGFTASSASGVLVSNCVAYNNTTSGFAFLFGRSASYVNCIANQNGTYGFDLSVGQSTMMLLLNCSTYLNTSGAINSAMNQAIQNLNRVIPSGDPFVAASSGNFALNNTAGAGALLRAQGFPGVFPGGLTTGSLDIGAVQHADPTPSGVGGGQMIAGATNRAAVY